jgi:uncharacterized membrane-anchored protein YitT (DUF2179 family)
LKRIGKLIKNQLLILLGVLSATLGLKAFLLPNHFIDGGATGISMLLAEHFDLGLPVFILLINTPFMFLGYRQIGRRFTIKSVFAVLALALSLTFIEIDPLTDDFLLAAVFGGFFLGAGIGLSIRGGSVIDGTEVMALIVSKKMRFTIGDVIFAVNVLIFSVAAITINMESAMYSVLTYLAASRTVNYLIHGIEEYTGVIIISEHHRNLREKIINELGRGVTVYKGTGGMSGKEQDILFSVVTRLEMPKMRSLIKELDNNAFVITHKVDDTAGGIVKKRVYH